MNTFQLKLLAVATMLVAHVGFFFLGDPLVLFAIGRIAFPIFAFLLAIGAKYTTNTKSYLSRLLIFAIISQIPYIAAYRVFYPDYWTLNILFTLFLGLLAITLSKGKTLPLKLGIILAAVLTGYAFQTSYGGLGVLSVIAFYYTLNKKGLTILSQIVIFSFINLEFLIMLYLSGTLNAKTIPYTIPFAIFSLIPIYFYNHKQGKKMKYLFYVFYPTHYVVIYILLVAKGCLHAPCMP